MSVHAIYDIVGIKRGIDHTWCWSYIDHNTWSKSNHVVIVLNMFAKTLSFSNHTNFKEMRIHVCSINDKRKLTDCFLKKMRFKRLININRIINVIIIYVYYIYLKYFIIINYVCQ